MEMMQVKKPRQKIDITRYFWRRGSWSVWIAGIGTRKMMKSVTIFRDGRQVPNDETVDADSRLAWDED
jgi:hypothetical protein